MATLITLLTDFGVADSYVGEVKGVLLSQVHGVVLVDITHQVPPGDVRAGQYILSRDRKSTRLNSSHGYISYAVFCLKKKKHGQDPRGRRRQLVHSLYDLGIYELQLLVH